MSFYLKNFKEKYKIFFLMKFNKRKGKDSIGKNDLFDHVKI